MKAMNVLALAARMRAGEVEMSPYQLWEAAGEDQDLYRHAMVHAGAVVRHVPDGTPCKLGDLGCRNPTHKRPFTRCPDCGEELKEKD